MMKDPDQIALPGSANDGIVFVQQGIRHSFQYEGSGPEPDREVAFLRVEPGPALCESMLRCYFASKPYVYDPFNATRMVGLGKLDANVVAAALRRHQYGAIQVNGPLADQRRTEMFAPPILAAIRESYHSAFENQDGAIYVPIRGGSPK